MINKFVHSRMKDFIVTLQEGFVSLLPYLLISSTGILVKILFETFNISIGRIDADLIGYVSIKLTDFAAIGALITISFRFAIRKEIDRVISILLSLSVYTTISVVITYLFPELANIVLSGAKLNLISIIIPIISIYILKQVLSKIKPNHMSMGINIHVNRVFKYIIPFFVSYFIASIMFGLFLFGYHYILLLISDISVYFPRWILLTLRVLFSQLCWFVGVHGSHLVNAIFNVSFLAEKMASGLSYGQFVRLFATSGGAGMGLSLFIALFIVLKKNNRDMLLIKVSAPFVIFNINTLLIFGLPLVFNTYLFIPFIFIPILNLGLAYTFINLYNNVFISLSVPWTTPTFLNVYITSGGDYFIILFYLFLVILGVMIYYPFLNRYILTNSPLKHCENLERKLDIVFSLQAKESLSAYEAQYSIIKSNRELDKIISFLDRDNLMIYYQPKVSIVTGESISYEALLRIKLKDGSLSGPYFIENVEQAGLASIMDLWVCKMVKDDMDKWATQDFDPYISINLHPDTLMEKNVVVEICTLLSGYKVEFEIIERSLLDNKKARNMLNYIQSKNFKVSIDDFGVGHSNFDTIVFYNIDSIKLDKTIVDRVYTKRGLSVCKHIVSLCNDLGIYCVAEGVETQYQLERLKEAGVELYQGYLFSKAVSSIKIFQDREVDFVDKILNKEIIHKVKNEV